MLMTNSELEIEINVSASDAYHCYLSFETHARVVRTSSFIFGVLVGLLSAVSISMTKIGTGSISVWMGINTGLTVFIGFISPVAKRYFQLDRYLSESEQWNGIREDYLELSARLRSGCDVQDAVREFEQIRRRETRVAKSNGTLTVFPFLRERIARDWKRRVGLKA